MNSVNRTVVHLLRHGKVHNPQGLLYGLLPGFHLAASGREMALAVADSLAGRDITHLVASSLLRAQETAAPIAAAFGMTVVTDDRVIEATNVFQGSAVVGKGGALTKPSNWLKLRRPLEPSWGEPYLDVAHRMMAGIADAERIARGHEAVIVSHQLPIWTARRYLEGKRLWHNPSSRECSVASLTSLTFENGVFQRADYSEPAGHIPAVDDPPGTPAGPAPAAGGAA